MHELRIAEDLAAMVAKYAAEAGLTKVVKVNVSFGQYIQIVPDLFRAAFSEATKDTVAEGAEIGIEIIAAEMRCMRCGTEYSPAGDLHACSLCGSEDIAVVHGKELFVKSIEGG